MVVGTNEAQLTCTKGVAIPILGTVEQYDWGIRGNESLVGKLWKANQRGPVIPNKNEKSSVITNKDQERLVALNPNEPYAEFWMGTHPKAPSKVQLANGQCQNLSDYLSSQGKNKKLLTFMVIFLVQLVFLFKVLSVGKALSIQAHPDRELARELHLRDPNNYKDDNHKPEMAIALTPFEALCGFRPLSQIAQHLTTVPELIELGGKEEAKELIAIAKESPTINNNRSSTALQNFFAKFISADVSLVKQQFALFKQRIGENSAEPLATLCLRLHEQFPNEVGCFCVFILNYICLKPSEAIFLAANEPHAYISGDCIECMALSDNVVRAGLTPKFRDVPTLVKMLTYRTCHPNELAMRPSPLPKQPYSLLYKPPVREFQVIKVEFGDDNQNMEETILLHNYSIMICVKGQATLRCTELDQGALHQIISLGSVLLLEPNKEYKLQSSSASPSLFFIASSQ